MHLEKPPGKLPPLGEGKLNRQAHGFTHRVRPLPESLIDRVLWKKGLMSRELPIPCIALQFSY